ncbi:hypothetical protein [Tepidicella xavieri]|jgi:hypothetical protein|uniref:Uncharacterized protein n=1 Tax=Tepidicella xavieri TaxID=360241 RepID=A0A4R6TZS2_9BURK|nr:hypothetical protein [Tepidicella xavieri]TDQ38402.1 hypothetical protein DFR43_1218 [Tepidicella xavieri]
MFTALSAHPWAYPLLEVVHLWGIALIIGNLMALEVRVWGGAAQLPVSALARLSLVLVALGFALAAGSGLLMFATQPEELLANRAFLTKMALLLLAGCNAAWFHGRRSLHRLDLTARLLMLLSALLWIGILLAGRWIAYI